MPGPRSTLARLLGSTVAVTALLATATVVPAHAAGSPPVALPDRVTVVAGDYVDVDVLANDSDPDGDRLAVCRISDSPDPTQIVAINGESSVFVSAAPGTTGIFEFTYYACDFETLVPATLTVTVTAAPVRPAMKVVVKKLKNRPGRIKVVNRNRYPFTFQWGHLAKRNPDGTVRVPAGSSKVVRVKRRAIVWVAVSRRGDLEIGYLKGIKLPRGVKALPPSPSPYLTGSPLRSPAAQWHSTLPTALTRRH
ncbi:MAG: Ig-like domain-containing protein [Nocardioides sp.]|uniref:Ig-like domain-containing protein n=1 Tax=Nocardioides sp. TaxID=35761 RepID=UPI003F06428E